MENFKLSLESSFWRLIKKKNEFELCDGEYFIFSA